MDFFIWLPSLCLLLLCVALLNDLFCKWMKKNLTNVINTKTDCKWLVCRDIKKSTITVQIQWEKYNDNNSINTEKMACVLMWTIKIDKRLKCFWKTPEQRRDNFLHHNRYIGYDESTVLIRIDILSCALEIFINSVVFYREAETRRRS